MNHIRAIVCNSQLSTQIIPTADAKVHAVIEHSADDAYVALLCKAAQSRIQNIIRRQILAANFTAFLDCLPWTLQLPYGNNFIVNTSFTASLAPGVQVITPASMVGITVGTYLTLSQIGNEDEVVLVTAVTGTTFTCTITHTYSDLTTVTSNPVNYIQYYDEDNKLRLVARDVYSVDVHTEPLEITLNTNKCWPGHYHRKNAFRINWTAGWPNVDIVPEQLKLAIKTLVATWYNKREDTDIVKHIEVPNGILSMVTDYKMQDWGY